DAKQGSGTVILEPPTPLSHRLYGSRLPADLAFSSATLASVLSGSSSAWRWHDLQHRNTGWSLTISLNGTPIEPRRGWCLAAQNFCCSASFRSSGLSLASPS